MRRLPRIAWLCLALGVLAVGMTTAVLAQTGGTYDLTWNSTKPGGTSSGDTYAVQGVAGEIAGGSSGGGAYTLQGGFVTGLTGTVAVPSPSPSPSPSPPPGPGGFPIRGYGPQVAKDGVNP